MDLVRNCKNVRVPDDDLTKLMGEAFDAACRELLDKGQPPIVQEVLAKRILSAVRRGERDPERLRDAAAIGHQASQDRRLLAQLEE